MAEDQERSEERDSAARPVTAAARRERRASAGGSTPASRATESGPAKPRRAGQSSGARTRKAVLDKPDAEESEAAGSDARGTTKKGRATPSRDRREKQPGVFTRLVRFLREVVGELRKVIWPTRKQQITYTVVVLVFVAVIVALVSGLDLLFGKGVFWIFA